MIKMRKIFALILLCVIVASCSKYQKILNSSDIMQKYNAGIDFYEREDYGKALRLFEDLKASFRGTDKDELVSYYIAQCTFNEKDYQLGSYYFYKFSKDFPNSKYNEEALFMTAYCEYLESPKYSLDQTTSLEAIKKFQIFIDQYPNSTRIARCNELLDSLRDKLEKKAYENAMLYYKIGSNSFGAFQASIVTLKMYWQIILTQKEKKIFCLRYLKPDMK